MRLLIYNSSVNCHIYECDPSNLYNRWCIESHKQQAQTQQQGSVIYCNADVKLAKVMKHNFTTQKLLLKICYIISKSISVNIYNRPTSTINAC